MIHTNRSRFRIDARLTLACSAIIAIAASAISPRVLAEAQEDTNAASCDCSCSRFIQLVDQSLPQSPAHSEERWACASACAIAWVQCEDREALVEVREDETDGEPNQGQAFTASARIDVDH